MKIQKATKDRLPEIHALIRDSITLLCSKDHRDNPEILDFWLANRSIERLEDIVFEPESRGFLCVENGKITGVSHLTRTGELTLCYVHPEYPGRGLGTQLLTLVETQARHWELSKVFLVSTSTAKSFYEANGYSQYADEVSYLRMPGYPMSKNLAVSKNA